MQFVVTAYDGTDSEAPSRRAAARPAHLEHAAELEATGQIIAGGAILNDAGEMIGSTLYMEFASREELDAWIAVDPYVTGDVWQKITIQPIRLAIRP
jgi:uncharacterized protein YciI